MGLLNLTTLQILLNDSNHIFRDKKKRFVHNNGFRNKQTPVKVNQ